MIDILVLDEADRMIADGHFKELKDILAHIYTQRLKIKKRKPQAEINEAIPKFDQPIEFREGKPVTRNDVDLSKVKDLFDEDEVFEEMK